MTTQRYAAGLSPDVFVINMDEGKNENLPYIPEPDYDNSSEEADGTSDEVSDIVSLKLQVKTDEAFFVGVKN